MTATSPADLVRAHLHGTAGALQRTARETADALVGAAEIISGALVAGGKLLLCGNGGSAAQCQHLAAEFVNLLDRRRERPGLAAIALTADSAVLSATANDRGFAEVFARQIEALGRPGDVLLALSTSGNSPSIVRALAAAKARQLVTILLTGETPGAASAHAMLTIRVPSPDTQHIQETHLALGHALVAVLEGAAFGNSPQVGT